MTQARRLQRICVFTGASLGGVPAYSQAATALGQVLVKNGIELVYGGGSVGLMGVIADAVLANGGKVHGVIPESLAVKELMHASLSQLTVVESMHVRKQTMSDLADAFIAMPGGFGTFDELFEILTWAQLGIHAKPIGLLNVAGYFDALLKMVDVAVTQGFVAPVNRSLFIVDTEPAALVEGLRTHTMPVLRQWASSKQT